MTPSYRPDVDGLRAIAILLVVTFHAFPDLLPGGYLGVDVFFVISGYLITQLVSRGSARDPFRLANFYARRVRRLFPALFLVSTACLVFGWFALLPDEYSLLGKHALGASLFVPNVAFWMEAGYWDKSSEWKPLLHLWSIGVEEQFYLVWPGIVLLLARYGRSLSLWGVPMAVASFAASLGTSAVAAFFLPQFRMWELMLGGLLAHASGHANSDRDAAGANAGSPAHRFGGSNLVGNAQSLLGLTLIVVAAAMFEGDAKFSAWSALLPVVGSALVLASPGAVLNRLLLANRGMVLLGKVSYPLYLWHWPLLSFATIVESGAVPAQWRLALLALSLVLAGLTYRLVEIPVRSLTGVRGVVPLVVCSVVAGAAGGLVHLQKGFPHRTQALASQLEAFEWESKGLYERDDCAQALGLFSRCLSNGKPHQVAVLGDSYSTNTFFVLQEFYRDGDTGVMRLGKAGCLPFYDVDRHADGVNLKCRETMNQALDYVLGNEHIRTVVLSLRPSLYIGNAGGNRLSTPGDPAPRSNPDVFRSAMERTIGRFVDSGKEVIYALDWPELDFDPKACVDVRPLRFSRYSKIPCVMDRAEVDARDTPYRAMVLETLAKFPRTRYWDPKKLLCDDRTCRAMRDGVMIYRDGHHLSLIGSAYLGRRFATDDPPRN